MKPADLRKGEDPATWRGSMAMSRGWGLDDLDQIRRHLRRSRIALGAGRAGGSSDAQPAGPEGPRSPGRLPWATLLAACSRSRSSPVPAVLARAESWAPVIEPHAAGKTTPL